MFMHQVTIEGIHVTHVRSYSSSAPELATLNSSIPTSSLWTIPGTIPIFDIHTWVTSLLLRHCSVRCSFCRSLTEVLNASYLPHLPQRIKYHSYFRFRSTLSSPNSRAIYSSSLARWNIMNKNEWMNEWKCFAPAIIVLFGIPYRPSPLDPCST